MSAHHQPFHLVSVIACLALLGSMLPGSALAQDRAGGRPMQLFDTTDSIPPEVHIVPDSGAFADSLLNVTIYWCDDKELDPDSRTIKHGFAGVVGNFTMQSIIFAEPCNVFGDVYKSEGTIDISVSGSLTASIKDEFGGHTGNDQATYTYTAPQPPTLTLEKHNGDNRDRSLCLTSGAGEAAAYQCGDLLVTHAMPAYATKGRDRSLTLLYNSDQAAPRAVVTAELSMPAPHNPDSIEVKLKFGSTEMASAVYKGVSWAAGQPRQISIGFVADNLPTGLHPFTLVAKAIYPTEILDSAPVSDTLIIVNRRDSEFGLGWSLAGIERLVLDQPGGTGDDILWVGGDGSAKRYRKSGSLWIGAEGAFRDTITLSGNVYTRRLKHGVKVEFWNQGLHIRTINRTQDTTRIKWGGGVIDTIQVPTAGATTRKTYTLHYSGSPLTLDSIVDPTGRVLAATVDGSDRLTGLTDPDGEEVAFVYQSSGRMTRRTNRRGIGTKYAYDRAWKLTDAQVPLDVAAGDTAWTRFTNHDESWLALGLGATPYPQILPVRTTINGPRTTVSDLTRFWIDRWGAPTQIQDAFFQNTWIARGDPDAPALPSRIQYADGRVVKFDWNSRANLEVQSDSTIGAMTEWTYNLTGVKADSPDSLIAPDGEVTRFTYTTDGLTDRVTAPNGHVTDFDYGSGNLKGLVSDVTEESVPVLVGSSWSDSNEELVTAFTYDDWGNIETQTSPLGNTTTYRRDNKNRVIRVVDAVGDSTGRSYDALNRVTFTKVYTSSGTITTTRDWGIDFLEEVIDPRGVTRGFDYDDAGRLVKEIDEQDEADEFGYDEAGNRIWAFTRLLQAQNDTIYFQYDKANRLIKKHWPARTATIPECTLDSEDYLEFYFGCLTTGTPDDSITYGYDAMGRMEEARTYESDPAYTLTQTYREDGLVLSEVRDDGTRVATNRYDYSPGGKRTLHVIGGGPQTWEAPDSVFHVYHQTSGDLDRTVVEWGYGSTRRDSVRFFWDELGRRKRLLYSTHSGTSAPIDVKFNYDKDGRLRRVCSTHGGSVSGSEDAFKIREAYSYNDDGTMRQRYRVSGSVQSDTECTANSTESAHGYAYDQRKQLVADTATGGLFEYDFDDSGNMIEKRSIFGGGGSDTLRATFTIPVQSNRIAEYNPNAESSVHYDHHYYDNGTRRAEWWTAPTGSAIGSRLYSLDGLGRMAAMTFLNACDNPLTSQGLSCVFNTVQPDEPVCSYDPLDRLVHLCGTGGSALVFDGDNVVRNGADDAEHAWSFVHSPGVDNPIMGHRQFQIEQTHDYVYFVTDGNGRHLAAGDSTGLDHTDPSNGTQFNIYMAGPVYAGGIHNSFGFSATRQPSAELAGISFFRNRWLDTRTGRWTQEDPIGLAGGVNLYQYAGNNPATYTDPFGLCPPEDENYDDCAPTSPHYWANREAQGEGSSLANHVAGVAATVVGNLAADQCPDCLNLVGPSFIGGPASGGRGIAALIKDAADNPGNWRTVSAHVEQAVSRKAAGGVSIQRVIRNDAGEELVEHTLRSKSGRVLEQHFRPYLKPPLEP